MTLDFQVCDDSSDANWALKVTCIYRNYDKSNTDIPNTYCYIVHGCLSRLFEVRHEILLRLDLVLFLLGYISSVIRSSEKAMKEWKLFFV